MTRDDSYQSNAKFLLNKKVVITNASGGMGHAMTKKFGHAGAKLLLLNISEQGLQERKKILHNIGSEAEIYICDVSDIKSIPNCAAPIFRQHGGDECLINNAGILSPAMRLEKLETQNGDSVFSINVRGAFLSAQQFGLQMLQKKSAVLPTLHRLLQLSGWVSLLIQR